MQKEDTWIKAQEELPYDGQNVYIKTHIDTGNTVHRNRVIAGVYSSYPDKKTKFRSIGLDKVFDEVTEWKMR